MILFSYLILLLLCIVCVCTRACVCASVSCQRTSLWSHFSSFACTRVPEIKPRSSGLRGKCVASRPLTGPMAVGVLGFLLALTATQTWHASGSLRAVWPMQGFSLVRVCWEVSMRWGSSFMGGRSWRPRHPPHALLRTSLSSCSVPKCGPHSGTRCLCKVVPPPFQAVLLVSLSAPPDLK